MTSKEPSKFSNNIDELSPCLNTLDDSIKDATEAMQFLFNNPKAKMTDRVSKLHKAKMEIVSMYCTNSMFWEITTMNVVDSVVYLKTQGVNVTEHPITKELDRVKALLRRLKEIEDKKLAPKINTDASKRVMRNALWTAAQKRKPDDKTGEGDAAGSDTRYEITDRITGEMTAVSKETSTTTAGSSVVKAEKLSPKKSAKLTSGGPSKKKKKKH